MSDTLRNAAPLGLFDSGAGGLSILQAVRRLLPHEDLIYFADQKFCPYGPRPASEIRSLSERVTRFLLGLDCKAIVVACNTASAAALEYLREARAREADFYLDSELVVRQLKGEYRVKEPRLQVLHGRALLLLNAVPRHAVHHVPREKNARADGLANEALDAEG